MLSGLKTAQPGYRVSFLEFVKEQALNFEDCSYEQFMEKSTQAREWLDAVTFQFGVQAAWDTQGVSVYVAIFDSNSVRLVLVPPSFDKDPWENLDKVKKKKKIMFAFFLYHRGHFDYIDINGTTESRSWPYNIF